MVCSFVCPDALIYLDRSDNEHGVSIGTARDLAHGAMVCVAADPTIATKGPS